MGNGPAGPRDLRAHVAHRIDSPEDAGPVESTARTGRDGAFTLVGLRAGAYRLYLSSEHWMLSPPLHFWTDDDEIVGAAVPAVSVNLQVRDLETNRPLSRFRVRALAGGVDEGVVLEGRDGRLARRFAWPRGPGTRVGVTFEVAANAYVPARCAGRETVWLQPEGRPNAALSVRFSDGTPYRGELWVELRAAELRTRGSTRFTRDASGLFRGMLPPGRWLLQLTLSDLLFTRRTVRLDVNVTADGWKREVVLPAGGTLVLRAPPGAKGTKIILLRRAERGAYSVRVRAEPPETVVAGVPPGDYEIGYEVFRRFGDGRSTVGTRWPHDVRVTVGARTEVQLVEPTR